MQNFKFSWQSSAGLSSSDLDQYKKQLAPPITNFKQALSTGYQTPFGSINLPADEKYYQQTVDLIAQKQKLNPKAIILIGIGGSSQGAKAIWQATQSYHAHAAPRFLCIETLDPDALAPVIGFVDTILRHGNSVLVIVISKSGTTTETVANFLVFQELLKKHHPERYHEYIVAITDRDSALFNFALLEKYATLEIPQEVGGRYSVFSAAGLFPLGMVHIDIASLRAGAQNIIESCLDNMISKNPAAITAAMLDYHYKKNISIADLFLFSPFLYELGDWYCQLVAESLGKTKIGSSERVGITPTVSIATMDLHSMAQLYLGGPNNRCTLFVTIEKYAYEVHVPKNNPGTKLNPLITGKSFKYIMQSIAQGVQNTYQQQQLPFITCALENTNTYAIGQFMQYCMIMVSYLAELLQVNAFDQPQVELYKEETRKILSHE